MSQVGFHRDEGFVVSKQKKMRFLQVVILDLLNRNDRSWSIPEILEELGLHHYRTYTTRLVGSPDPNVRAHERRLGGYPSLMDWGAAQSMIDEDLLTGYSITPEGRALLEQQLSLFSKVVKLAPGIGSQPACAKLFARIKGLGAVIELLPDELDSATPFREGSRYQVLINAYERNPEARRRSLVSHGTNCCICGFNFGEAYGPEANGYIHVHHIQPLSEVNGEYEVDPVVDLRPVCPNCHAVIHLGGRCRGIEEVKQMIKRNR
jgi:hypothetical protein